MDNNQLGYENSYVAIPTDYSGCDGKFLSSSPAGWRSAAGGIAEKALSGKSRLLL